MKKTLSVIATLALLFFGAACVPQETNTSETGDKEGNTETSNAPSVTVGADNISAISVVLKGKANLTSSVSSDLSMGIMWSKNTGVLPSNSTKTEATNMDGDYNYSVGITSLEPETTYYYRSYVTQNGQDTYGETKSFTTKAVDTMIMTSDATAISAISARINSVVDMTDVQFNKKIIGFYFGTSPESLSKREQTNEEDSRVFVNLSKLSPNSTYYFCGYVVLDGKEYKSSEAKSFTTKELSSLVATEEATSIEPTCAKLNAHIDLTDVQYTDMEYGFNWGASEKSQPYKKSGESNSINTFSVLLSHLSHKTQYWYKAFVRLDDQILYGDVRTFTTDVVHVVSIFLDIPNYTFHAIGDTRTLMATVIPADATDKSVEWTTSDSDVATVDPSGKVSAVGNGISTISVTTKDKGRTASCEVTVAQWVTSISLDQTSISLNEGQEQTLIPTVNPDDAAEKTLKWTSSNEAVAVVDNSGKVTALSKGSATIKAESVDGSGKRATCSVIVEKPVASIQLNKATMSIFTGNTETITATVIPSDASNKAVTWSSTNTSIATVSSSGMVTGRTKGTTTITATAKDGNGASATCEVEVKQSVTSILLNKTSISLNEGQEQTLIPTVNPDDAAEKTLKWTSSNEAVAVVDNSGKVTALSKGSATIKAESQDGSGKYATCSVTVNRPVASIELNKTSLVLSRGTSDVTEKLIATVIPSDASNQAVTWSSSNTSVVAVSESGVVTGRIKGLATITVTADDGNGAGATCEVEVKQYVTSISLDKTSLALVVGDEATLSVIAILPDDANNKNFVWSTSDNAIASVDNNGKVTAKSKGRTTIIAETRDGSGVFGSCLVNVINPSPSGAVDLGLSVKWATSNLSNNGLCANPYDYGDRYSWGETEPKSEYSWSTYKFGASAWGPLSKYNTEKDYGSVDNKKELEPEDDAAHVILGDAWRMPTVAEWRELLTQCSWTWTTLNGVNGQLGIAENENYIFLPADSEGNGAYWSSSLKTPNTGYAWWVVVYVNGIRATSAERYYGLSVRPVLTE